MDELSITISLPGPVVSFLQGTTGFAMSQGDLDYWGDAERDAQVVRLFDALRAAPSRKVGKGFTVTITVTEMWGLVTLVQYLHDIVECNEYGDRDEREFAAVKRVLNRLMPEARNYIEPRGFSWEPKHPSTKED